MLKFQKRLLEFLFSIGIKWRWLDRKIHSKEEAANSKLQWTKWHSEDDTFEETYIQNLISPEVFTGGQIKGEICKICGLSSPFNIFRDLKLTFHGEFAEYTGWDGVKHRFPKSELELPEDL